MDCDKTFVDDVSFLLQWGYFQMSTILLNSLRKYYWLEDTCCNMSETLTTKCLMWFIHEEINKYKMGTGPWNRISQKILFFLTISYRSYSSQ